MTSGTSYSPATDRHESHYRRRRSSDPQASTTVSQMDVLIFGLPTSGRDLRAFGSITEEGPLAMSFAMAPPNNTPGVGFFPVLRLTNLNFYQTDAAASRTPSLRVPSINVDSAPSLHESPSVSSDEYKFDVIPPVRIFPAIFCMVWSFTGILQ